MSKLANFISKVGTALIGDRVVYKGITLPPRHYRLGGQNFRDDAKFVSSAQSESRRLVNAFGLNQSTSLLEIGCGYGRLPIGIFTDFGKITRYEGVDVNPSAINWCNKYIQPQYPFAKFTLSNVHNDRYNQGSNQTSSSLRLPFEDSVFDIVYMYSVFSHMLTHDVDAYLGEFSRVLKPQGKIFLTAFVEKNVPDCEENPANYRQAWKGPLHCVRFDQAFFEGLLGKHGFATERFVYEQATDGQSEIYIGRA